MNCILETPGPIFITPPTEESQLERIRFTISQMSLFDQEKTTEQENFGR